MSKKKKKNKTDYNTIIILAIPMVLIILIVGVAFGKMMLAEKKEYKISSRIAASKNKRVGEDGTLKTVGWVKIDGTSIDLPVVFNTTEDKEYPVEVEEYAWIDNFDTEFHNSMKIKGHNIFNLSSNPEVKSSQFQRFEELMSFVYYDKAKENQYIQLTLDDQEYVYKIFAVAFIPSRKVLNFPFEDDYTPEEMDKYLKQIAEYNMYDYDIDVKNTDKVISLITCTHFYGLDESNEFYVLGRLVRDGEKTGNYSVKKNKNYERVEKQMKGDEKNEDEKA